MKQLVSRDLLHTDSNRKAGSLQLPNAFDNGNNVKSIATQNYLIVIVRNPHAQEEEGALWELFKCGWTLTRPLPKHFFHVYWSV